MNNEKQEYLLLFRGSNNWYKELSPEELQQVMAKIGAWFESLNAKGIVKGGQPAKCTRWPASEPSPVRPSMM